VTPLKIALVGSLLIASATYLPAPILEMATPAPKSRASHSAAQAATATKPATGARHEPASVFIYRPAGFPWGMYNTSTIIIDGVKVRTMADPRYLVRHLSPGHHLFEAKGGVITNQRVPIEIDLQSDQKYYLRMSIDAMGFPEGKILFTQVSNAQGAEEVAKLTQTP
jgi:hypothetical protein